MRASYLIDDAAAKIDEYLALVMRCNELFPHLTADEREGVEVALEYQGEQLYRCLRQLCDDLPANSLALRKAI